MNRITSKANGFFMALYLRQKYGFPRCNLAIAPKNAFCAIFPEFVVCILLIFATGFALSTSAVTYPTNKNDNYMTNLEKCNNI